MAKEYPDHRSHWPLSLLLLSSSHHHLRVAERALTSGAHPESCCFILSLPAYLSFSRRNLNFCRHLSSRGFFSFFRTNNMAPRQKYSIFLPIHRTSRAASRATSAAKDGARSPKINGTGKNSRSSAAAQTSKRRSTMNSRDAAYDEEEQLRRAIEASKEDAIPEENESVTTRRPKRGRDDSEECVLNKETSVCIHLANNRGRKLEGVKRQRTDSRSPSPVTEKGPSTGQDDSEDESSLRNGSKKSRNAARNAAREKTERDERKEEQERKRAEAASKRKGRAERRRADG